jgi:hypothetical protein
MGHGGDCRARSRSPRPRLTLLTASIGARVRAGDGATRPFDLGVLSFAAQLVSPGMQGLCALLVDHKQLG